MGGIGDRAHPARRFEADRPATGANGREDDFRRLQGRVDRNLAGRGLDEIRAILDGDLTGAADQRRLGQFARFDDHFQCDVFGQHRPYPLDQAGADAPIAADQGAPGKHHIHLIGPFTRLGGGLCQDGGEIGAAGGKVGDGCQPNGIQPLVVQRLARRTEETVIDAQRSGSAERRLGRLGKRADRQVAVAVIERGQVEKTEDGFG